jgi:YfiR/HmsC-like
MTNGNDIMAGFMLGLVTLASLYPGRSFGSAGKWVMYPSGRGEKWRCLDRPDMKLTPTTGRVTQAWTAWLILFYTTVLAVQCGFCGEEPPVTEYQVKALRLLSFAKYVDWPARTFTETNSPIVVGVIGEDKFGDDLKHAMEGKCVGGRKIVVAAIDSEKDWDKCQILFVSASETGRQAEVLNHVKSLPILTVGESEHFTRDGGVINFTKKDGKVRFDVDLTAARSAGLGISSKLLSLADTVRGKP